MLRWILWPFNLHALSKLHGKIWFCYGLEGARYKAELLICEDRLGQMQSREMGGDRYGNLHR